MTTPQITTDNSETLVNALAQIEALKAENAQNERLYKQYLNLACQWEARCKDLEAALKLKSGYELHYTKHEELKGNVHFYATAAEMLPNERDALKIQVAEWVKANSPGGWIDDLRSENAGLNLRIEHDFRRWQEAIANYDFERSLNEKLMDGSAKLCAENLALRTERDELKADAEQWRKYKARKDAAIAHGFGRNPLRREA